MASPMQMDPLKALGATPVRSRSAMCCPRCSKGQLMVFSPFCPYWPRCITMIRQSTSQTNLSFAVSMFVLSKTWFDRLASDLQKIVAEDSARIGDDMHPLVVDFYNAQKKAWSAAGGQVLTIS